MMSEASTSVARKVCCFCGSTEDNELEYGKFYEYGDITTHYYCLLLSSNMRQRGKDNEGILGFLLTDIHMELRRGRRLVCTYCKKSGATLGCCNLKCKKVFHYPCGLKDGALNQFFGEFRTYCRNHRLKQKIDKQVLEELKDADKADCCICYEHVDPYDKFDTLWAPCCKKNAWFHRKCAQQLAQSTGYFFKCPLCNNKNLFQDAMKDFGIFIPHQDASWELVPNPYEELLYRHDQCDAPTCICPKGRKHNKSLNARWELILCRTCGSQGVHMACAQLKWSNPVWECEECKSILGKFNGSSSTATTSGENSRVTSGETIVMLNVSDSDWDSDISVDDDSPPQFTSSLPILTSLPEMVDFKERPGPRTYKLRQRLEAKRKLQQARLAELKEVSTDASESRTISCESKKTFSVSSSSSQLSQDDTIILDDDDIDIIEITKCNAVDDVSMVSENRTHKSSSSPSNAVKLVGNNDSSIDVLKVETVDLEELSSQDDVLSDDPCDSISGIKITNVISLSPNEFDDTVTIDDGNDVDTISQNSDELIIDNSIISHSKEDCTKSTCKRKFNDTTSNTTTIFEEEVARTSEIKKLRLETTSPIILEETRYVPVYVPLDPIELASDENNFQSNTDINSNASTDILIDKTDTLPCNTVENCDGDTGKSPVGGTSNGDNVDRRRINRNRRARSLWSRSKPRKNKSRNLAGDQRKCENNTNVSVARRRRRSRDKFDCWRRECEIKNCDHSRLMPEYVRLRDLKFRIRDTNNLQMILFNEFSVNIKMNDPATMFDESIKNNNEQNSLEDESFPNVKSGNILKDISPSCHKDKSKTVFTNGDYQDDTKENMDPVTITYKNVADMNLLSNATLIANNVTAINSQIENENLMQPMCNVIKDDDGRNNENSLIDGTENDMKHLGNKCSKTSFSPRSVRRTLFQETSKKEKSKNKIGIKVSIDLHKIQPFMDSNPDLFSKYTKESNDQANEQAGFLKERNNIRQPAHSSNHNLVADKTNCFEDFSSHLPKYKTIETETVKNIEENTVNNQRRASNSSKR